MQATGWPVCLIIRTKPVPMRQARVSIPMAVTGLACGMIGHVKQAFLRWGNRKAKPVPRTGLAGRSLLDFFPAPPRVPTKDAASDGLTPDSANRHPLSPISVTSPKEPKAHSPVCHGLGVGFIVGLSASCRAE